jgi:hypothetical protein
VCCAVAQEVSRRLPTAAARFEPWSDHVGFVVQKEALGLCFFRVLRFLPPNNPPIAPHSSSSGTGTIDQWPNSGLGSTPSRVKKKRHRHQDSGSVPGRLDVLVLTYRQGVRGEWRALHCVESHN